MNRFLWDRWKIKLFFAFDKSELCEASENRLITFGFIVFLFA